MIILFKLAFILSPFFGNDIPKIQPENIEHIFKHDSKILVVNFWATWCKPCVQELPQFEYINARYSDEVKVRLVSLDFPENIDSTLETFIKKHNLKSEIIYLESGRGYAWMDSAHKDWSGSIPATIILQHGSDDRMLYEKQFKDGELETIINTILQK